MCNGLRYYKKNYETCQTYTFYGFLIHASVIKIQQAHKGVQGRTRAYKGVQGCARAFKDVQGCTRVNKGVKGCKMV